MEGVMTAKTDSVREDMLRVIVDIIDRKELELLTKPWGKEVLLALEEVLDEVIYNSCTEFPKWLQQRNREVESVFGIEKKEDTRFLSLA
jgi:hypothetical protein